MRSGSNKRPITLDNGEIALATFPVVVSASRSTDIPAFYSDWFFYRLNKGYSAWINPFNGVKSYIGYADTRFIVFWSKNPKPLLAHLDTLKELRIGCYIQYSLNDYEDERLELGVPPINERIDTFKKLSEKLGKDAVIWRFDPLILTDKINIDNLLDKICNIGDQLQGYTNKLVFSFADIETYAKVRNNLIKGGIKYTDWTKDQMEVFAQRLVSVNAGKGWNLDLATCGETADLTGIQHNHCIDDSLILRLCPDSTELLDYFNAEIIDPTASLFQHSELIPQNAIPTIDGRYILIKKDNQDKGQRLACGCMKSKDIGQYNTCIHMCEYCYANTSKQAAAQNYNRHKADPLSDTITGI